MRIEAARSAHRAWALWLLAAAVLLATGLAGGPRWLDGLALVAPAMLFVYRGLGRGRWLVLGLAMVALSWGLSSSVPELPDLLRACAVFALGSIFAARARDTQTALEASIMPSEAEAAEEFERALASELARARRHEHSFVVLSAARERRGRVEPDSEPREGPDALPGSAIAALLAAELHRYATVMDVGERVLALVPETRDDELPGLVRRLREAFEQGLSFEVRLGAARFPYDALASAEIVAAADWARRAPPLRSVPQAEPPVPSVASQPGSGAGGRLPDAGH